MNPEKTAISRRGLSRPTRWIIANVDPVDKDVLHFGEGKAYADSDALRKWCGGRLVTYDPYSENEWSRGPEWLEYSYGVVVANYVLNVLEPDERRVAFEQIMRCAIGGVAYITLRTDKVKGIAYEDGVVSTRYTFQKTYTPASAVEEFGGRVAHKGSGFIILEVIPAIEWLADAVGQTM